MFTLHCKHFFTPFTIAIFHSRVDQGREGRFISTFLDLVDSFMPNFQVSLNLSISSGGTLEVLLLFCRILISKGWPTRSPVFCWTAEDQKYAAGRNGLQFVITTINICTFWIFKDSKSFDGPPSHIQFVDMPVDSSYMDGVSILLTEYFSVSNLRISSSTFVST